MAQPNKQSLLPEVLGRITDSEVSVGIKGGRQFRGKLRSFDLHMNLVLDDGVSFDGGRVNKRYGTILLRGDSVVFVAPLE